MTLPMSSSSRNLISKLAPLAKRQTAQDPFGSQKGSCAVCLAFRARLVRPGVLARKELVRRHTGLQYGGSLLALRAARNRLDRRTASGRISRVEFALNNAYSRGATMETTTAIVLGATALSLILVAYSLFALFASRKGAVARGVRMKMEDVALDLMGLAEPKLKELLNHGPEELEISLNLQDAPGVRREASVVARHPNRAEERVVMDVGQRERLEGLVRALMGEKRKLRMREKSLVH